MLCEPSKGQTSAQKASVKSPKTSATLQGVGMTMVPVSLEKGCRQELHSSSALQLSFLLGLGGISQSEEIQKHQNVSSPPLESECTTGKKKQKTSSTRLAESSLLLPKNLLIALAGRMRFVSLSMTAALNLSLVRAFCIILRTSASFSCI